MGRFLTLLFLSATLALFYVKFLRPEDPPPEPPPAAAIPEVTPIAKLSTFAGPNIGVIFSQLDGKPLTATVLQLRNLRSSVADRKPKLSAELQAMYQGGIELCDVLLEVIHERERGNFSLNDTRSKPYSTALSEDQIEAERQKREFFEGGIQARWTERATPYRKRADALYKQLRENERRLTPPPTPAPGG